MSKEEWLQNQWRECFYNTQRDGAEQFGTDWLKVNNAVVQKIVAGGSIFNIAEQQTRALISFTILETLRTLKGDA